MRTIIVIPRLKYDKNVVTALRSAECFGATELCFIGNHNYEKISHLTKGAIKHIKINKFDNTEECINYLCKEKIKILCMENNGGYLLSDYRFPDNVALVMGHENKGVLSEFIDNFETINIPQYGLVNCLNTSVAMSIILYERFIQRLKL